MTRALEVESHDTATAHTAPARTDEIAGEQIFSFQELARLDEALTMSSRETGLRFTLYVGDLGTPTRVRAEELHARSGGTPSESVLIAVSPGLAIPVARPAAGRPVLVSHGRQDPVLPYAQTCGSVLPLLRTQKAEVTFRPFDGRHQMPAEIISEFLDRAFGPRPGMAARPVAADRSECTRNFMPPAEIPKA